MAKKIEELASELKKTVSMCTIVTMPFMICCGKKNRTVSIYECGKTKIYVNTDFIRLYNSTGVRVNYDYLFLQARTIVLIDFLIQNKTLTPSSCNDKINVE
jgi:hypothetical protein